MKRAKQEQAGSKLGIQDFLQVDGNAALFDEAALEAVATWRFRVIGIELDQLQMKRISRLVFKLED